MATSTCDDSIGNVNNKRKRSRSGSPLSSFPPATVIDDLPGPVLTNVATYLTLPERALFSVALTAPSSSALWRNRSAGDGNGIGIERLSSLSAASKSVLSSTSWAILNFADVEKRLAGRMKDDDLRAVLVCIDAFHQLKRLKLVGCNLIKGIGLDPLRGSTVLEQMDLSLIERNTEYLTSPNLSLEVVPIIESIVRKEGSAIRHIDLPPTICGRIQNSYELNSLLERYNQLLESRGSVCSKCDVICHDPIRDGSSPSSWIARRADGIRLDHQHFTCCQCTKHYCNKPQCNLNQCNRCQKYHCKEYTSRCDSCGKNDGCAVKCDDGFNCEQNLCEDCVETCQQCERSGCDDCLNFHRCPGCCGKGHCGDCHDGESVDGDEIYCEVCGYVQKSDY